MKTEIIPERLERFNLPDFHLRNGIGKGVNGEADVCIMQAVDWLTGGEGTSDAPECAAPMITRCEFPNDNSEKSRARLFAFQVAKKWLDEFVPQPESLKEKTA